MAGRSEVTRYSMPMRAIHWLTVLVVLTTYGLTYVVDLFARGTPERATTWWLHISFGCLLILLVAARFVARFTTYVPPTSAALSRPMAIASHAVHGLLYLLLIAVPTLGVLSAFTDGKAITLFGLIDIASPLVADKTLAHQLEDVHGLMADGLLILAGLHAAAALWHHFVQKDDVLRRMLPSHAR